MWGKHQVEICDPDKFCADAVHRSKCQGERHHRHAVLSHAFAGDCHLRFGTAARQRNRRQGPCAVRVAPGQSHHVRAAVLVHGDHNRAGRQELDLVPAGQWGALRVLARHELRKHRQGVQGRMPVQDAIHHDHPPRRPPRPTASAGGAAQWDSAGVCDVVELAIGSGVVAAGVRGAASRRRGCRWQPRRCRGPKVQRGRACWPDGRPARHAHDPGRLGGPPLEGCQALVGRPWDLVGG
mmetsp:Transcript_123682/g.395219  ORF Transcript_123682/g.395219 Transcript_123682/m.395219 type:complete len:238 (-) Transcript_123682:511-1224(-)